MKDQAVPPSPYPGNSVFRSLLAFLILSTSSIGLAALPMVTVDQGSDQGAKLSPWLAGRLETSAAPQEMLVVLDTEADLGAAAALDGRSRRRGFAYDALRGAALSSQSSLVAWLTGRGVEVEQRFWIVNAVLIRGDLDLARTLAALPGVARIVGNPVLKGLPSEPATFGVSIQSCPGEDPFGSPDLSPWSPTGAGAGAVAGPRPAAGALLSAGFNAQAALSPGSVETIEYGVAMVNADDVWTINGVRGEGIVVASMDTGVDWTHPAIQSKYRGWNGGSPDHSYSWHDPVQHTTAPLDDYGHGTHTVGTMLGDDGVGNQVGVAPGARWIGCRNMDHGNGTPALYLECMQWGLAPWQEGSDPMTDGRPDLGADITNNSWTCPPSEGCDALTLLSGFEHLRAAGQTDSRSRRQRGLGLFEREGPPGDLRRGLLGGRREQRP